MKKGGSRIWYFPDGYLPEKTSGSKLEAHEAIMLLNVGEQDAEVQLDFYFEEKPPVKNVSVRIPAERIKTLRLDNPNDLGGLAIPPLTQYSIRVRSDHPIVAQFGRLDTTQDNLAYYCAPGIWETE